MSGRLGDHNLPGVHAFREVLGKNLYLFIYHGGFRLRMKITDKKGMFTGRIQDSPRDALADLRGAPGTRPPGGPNSFNFMQFLGKNWPNNSLFYSWRPSSGKSWIRHWDEMPTLKSPGKLNEIWSTASPPRIPTGFWKRQIFNFRFLN